MNGDPKVGEDCDGRQVGVQIVSNRTFHFGYYAARMRLPTTQSVCSTIFTYKKYNEGKISEIDIEIPAEHDQFHKARLNTWRSECEETGVTRADKELLGGAPINDGGFHELGFDWRPTRVDYYCDGKFIHSNVNHVPQDPAHLMLAAWFAPWARPPPPHNEADFDQDRLLIEWIEAPQDHTIVQ